MAAPLRRRWAARFTILFVLLFSVALSACTGSGASPSAQPPSPTAGQPSPTPLSFPLSLIDDEGTSVELATQPQKIVSLTPAATETLFAIGAGPRTVGKVEDITPYPPEADVLPVVATYQGVKVEQIVALHADLVIAGGLGFTPPEAVNQLRRLNIPVLVLYATDVAAALSDIELIGDATGTGPQARDLTASMQAEIDQLSALAATADSPKVFYEIDATNGIYTVPENSLYAELLTLAGCDPITTDDSYKISLEKIVAADPAVILLGDGGYTTAADVKARPGWGGIKAVVDGAIRPVNDTLVTRPGPRLVEGLRALIDAIHPGLLPALSPLPTASATAP
jgi:iron complex transport system substrate-binding protein